jgi:hypothetical protein
MLNANCEPTLSNTAASNTVSFYAPRSRNASQQPIDSHLSMQPGRAERIASLLSAPKTFGIHPNNAVTLAPIPVSNPRLVFDSPPRIVHLSPFKSALQRAGEIGASGPFFQTRD